MTWFVKMPYAMFELNSCQGERMIAYGRSCLDAGEMRKLWEGCAPIFKGAIRCEEFRPRKLDLRFVEVRQVGNYDFFWFEDIAAGTKYPMFTEDVGTLLARDDLRREFSGEFEMVRHGNHYGIAPVSY